MNNIFITLCNIYLNVIFHCPIKFILTLVNFVIIGMQCVFFALFSTFFDIFENSWIFQKCCLKQGVDFSWINSNILRLKCVTGYSVVGVGGVG